MAKWSTFKWSDGTKWVGGAGLPALFTSFIDRLAYHISAKITQTTPVGATTPPTIYTISAEIGPRVQLPDQFEAFIDRNDNTQRVSVSIRKISSSNDIIELSTEGGDFIITEGGDLIVLELISPFSVDAIHMLANQRSHLQPVG